jgi:hypothetical protein
MFTKNAAGNIVSVTLGGGGGSSSGMNSFIRSVLFGS